jgi:ABC-2 type transport system ATP-binding protein
MLSVQNLSKRYGNLLALDQVSFEIPSNVIAGLIGPNGAGKTTLLLGLAGLLPVEGGRVSWDGRSVPAHSRSDTMFYVEDAIRPHALLSLRSALSFYGRVFQRTKAYCDELAERLGLRNFMASRVGDLSKGAAKRFLIAIGILSKQPVLMLDEPFDGLDLKQTLDLVPMLREISAQGRTLALSIHQLRDAERVCDRFVLLNNGRIAGHGTLAELNKQAGRPEGAGLEEIFLALT